MRQGEFPSICIIANREIAPLLLGLAEECRSMGGEVVFLAADEFAYQLVRQFRFPAVKRPVRRRLVYKTGMKRFEKTCKMDIGFTSLGINARRFWSRYFYKRADFFKRWLDRSWSLVDADLLLMFNGVQFFEQLTAEKFRKEGKKTIFMENGLFPGTAQLDPSGVNAFSEITSLPDGDLARSASSGELDAFVEKLKADFEELRSEPPSDLLSKYRLNRFRLALLAVRFLLLDLPFSFLEYASKAPFFIKRSRFVGSASGSSSFELPDRYVFFPLQVSADSQLLVHADNASMENSIHMVYGAVRKMTPKCRLVVKEHPLEKHINYTALRAELPDICWVKDIPLQEIIERSLCVVNFNSSVGLQALIYDKPVICLGNALYGRKGVSATPRNTEELEKVLIDPELGCPSRDLVHRFLYHLYHTYSATYDRRSVTKEQLQGLATKVVAFIKSAED